MTLPLETLKSVLSDPSKFIRQRAELNLPASTSLFPFRKKQREAIELALSNAPVVAIAGTPASGKTEIALAAIATAIAHQRSILVVAPFASTFSSYVKLPLPPLQIANNQDYKQSLKDWVGQQLRDPKLDFLPTHWLEDALFEELQTKRGRQFWLNLLHETELTKLTEKLAQSIAEIFPTIHPKRQELLVCRLKQAQTLLEQRERLYQDYRTLSKYAIEQIVDASISHVKAPILCLSDRLTILGDRLFDLVIVEDSHYLNPSLLQEIALRANKIVLLGELRELEESTENQNLFNKLFQNLLPAYRLQLTENHRLHPELASVIFPALYPFQPTPYTPTTQIHLPLKQGHYRLRWYDVKNMAQIEQTLQEFLKDSLDQQNHKICIYAFSSELGDRLQQLLPKLSSLIISNTNNLKGQEYESLWLIFDQSRPQPLKPSDLQILLTRAKSSITIIGDWEYYQNSFESLFSSFHFVRDIIINED